MKAYLRPSLSTSLVIFFFFILLFLGLFAEVFESQTPEVDLAQIYANPIPIDELQRLKSLRITNKHGNFFMENTHPEGNLNGPWQLTEPLALKVKDEVVRKIIESLNVIRVRNFHRLEPINLRSFSLDNPTLSMIFTTDRDKDFEIKIGLINPIDNSAYLSLSSQDQIYQIDPLEMALETYDLSEIVESKVLAINMDSLTSLEVYGQNQLLLKILSKDGEWLDQTGGKLSEIKVRTFLERLTGLKSFSILDNLSPEQKNIMVKTMDTPSFSIRIISNQGVRNYLIAEMKGSVPGLSIPPKNIFAFSTEEKQSFILIERDQLKILSTRSIELK